MSFADSGNMMQPFDIQYTGTGQTCLGESEPSIVLSGMVTPSPSRSTSMNQRPSLTIDDKSDYRTGGSSSTSSFNSSSGCLTPCSSSASMASTSRRQSAILYDSKHCYLSAASASPSFNSGNHHDNPNFFGRQLRGIFPTEFQEVVPDFIPNPFSGGTLSFCTDEGFSDEVGDHIQTSQMDCYAEGTCHESLPDMQESNLLDQSVALTPDLWANRRLPFNPRYTDIHDTCMDNQQPTTHKEEQLPIIVSPLQTVYEPIATKRPLLPPFDPKPFKHEDSSTSDDDPIFQTREEKRRQRKSKTLRKKERSAIMAAIGERTYPKRQGMNSCDFKDCPYACNRPEHLKRHKKSCHNPKPDLFKCHFSDCEDKKKKQRRTIVARHDNFKAHYFRTHFTYGASEKSGKNIRRSMKVSFEQGLKDFDHRWTMLLANRMTLEQKPGPKPKQKDKQPLNWWKMLGYSIRETREMKVKDIAPDWQGIKERGYEVGSEATLDKLDGRWKALRDGTMTYDQAMSVGKDMKETPRQGLLGVEMSETMEMGIAELDVRWQKLNDGEMSVEDSEKLGVRDRNPVWLLQQAKRGR